MSLTVKENAVPKSYQESRDAILFWLKQTAAWMKDQSRMIPLHPEMADRYFKQMSDRVLEIHDWISTNVPENPGKKYKVKPDEPEAEKKR